MTAIDQTVSVLAFDPGGTTGWAAITVPTGALDGSLTYSDGLRGALHQRIEFFDCGQIDCGTGGHGHEHAVGRGHGEVNIAGEIMGTYQMTSLALTRFPDSAVILEEFTLEQNNKHADLLLPVRVMAGFWNQLATREPEFHVGLHPVDRIFINRRVDAKTVVKDERLREWKLYRRNSGPHARDATRHAYHFLRRCRGSALAARELRWRAWPHAFEDPQIVQKPKRAKKVGERIQFLK